MIGNPKWFKPRKYSGWGITPVTWQGWAYLAVFLVPFAVFQALPFWNTTTRMAVTVAWLAILLFDVVDIMARIKKDEREYKIEAIAERNAAWIMVAVLAIAIVYQAITSALTQNLMIDYFLIAALIAGLLAKGISNAVLERGVV